MSSVRQRFSKFATSYSQLNVIQEQIAKKLVAKIVTKPKNIIDLGSGTGAVFRAVDWDFERFIAVDFAQNMCHLHPLTDQVTIVQADFNNQDDLKALDRYKPIDIVISSSSLQWSKDLACTLPLIREISPNIALAFFTAGTFKTIRQITDQDTFLLDIDDAKTQISSYFEAGFEVEKIKLDFANSDELFSYIRRSGVGGGISNLGFKKAKELLCSYPHNSLEFEILYAVTKNTW